MKDTLTLHHLLLESGTDHKIIRLPRTISAADQLPDVLLLPHGRCLVVRFYEADDVLTAFVVRANQVPPTWMLRSATGGQRIRAAPGETVSSVTGYAASLAAPLALPDSLPVFADEALWADLDGDTIVYTSTGESGTALGIRLLDLSAHWTAKPAALRKRQ